MTSLNFFATTSLSVSDLSETLRIQLISRRIHCETPFPTMQMNELLCQLSKMQLTSSYVLILAIK